LRMRCGDGRNNIDKLESMPTIQMDLGQKKDKRRLTQEQGQKLCFLF